MELRVFDSDFKGKGVIDLFNSIVWVDRYNLCGDFQIETDSIFDVLKYINKDYFVTNKMSEHTMIVETLEIKSNASNFNTLIIKGRSLESILDRRIVWSQTLLTGSLQNGIEKLLNENAISPTDPNRRILNLVFQTSVDPAITGLTVEAQFTGDSLYDAICNLCASANIGFKIIRNDAGQFVFSLYAGVDRSYRQSANPHVVFSPNFENFTSGDYLDTNQAYKTVTLVAGEGEGSDRKTVTVPLPSGAGVDLNRREVFTDAAQISQTTSEGPLTDEQYRAELTQKGLEKLAETYSMTAFEGQVEPNDMYVYGTHYFMGDILQVADNYGHQGTVQITEFILAEDPSGEKIYPTFAPVV